MKQWQWRLPVVAALMGALICCAYGAEAFGKGAATRWAASQGNEGTNAAQEVGYTVVTDNSRWALYQQPRLAPKSPFIEEETPMPDDEGVVIVQPQPRAVESESATGDPAYQPRETYAREYSGGGNSCTSCTPRSNAGCYPCRRRCDAYCPLDCGQCRGLAYGDCCDCLARRGIFTGSIFQRTTCCDPWLTIGGWIDQGITSSNHVPADRFNGPVTFNDRDREYQMNQLWVYAERVTDTGGCGFDVGGRVDFMYGTDWRFTRSNGLEDNWNESSRFYGAAFPQAYLDVAWNDWTVRMGHFYTMIGYEVVPAPQNFFYSHAYTMQYGEPFTHTGLLATNHINDGLSVSVGFDRGWDNWQDNNDKLEILGGVSASSYDGLTSLTFALTSGAYDDEGRLNRVMYSIVLQHQINCRLKWVLQHDRGFDNNGGILRQGAASRDNAEWYGINQYLFYDLNERWSLGLRTEWFRDDDGARVGGIGDPNGWPLGPDLANNQIGWAGNFYEVTFGLNWKPNCHLAVRPEFRWDWYTGPTDAQGQLPFNYGENSYQFTFGTDVYITF